MKQGDVYWYTFRAPDKRRPVLVLTRSVIIPLLTSVTVAPISTNIRNTPTEVFLSPEDGLFEDCAVNLDNIQTVPKSRLDEYIATLEPEVMREVRAAIAFAFDFKALR
jgi:mRNA interferase MazF